MAPTEPASSLSLVLYPVIFDHAPQQRAIEIANRIFQADGFVKLKEPELQRMIDEIRSELGEPSQQVRDIVQCLAPEKELREYLAIVADQIERLLS